MNKHHIHINYFYLCFVAIFVKFAILELEHQIKLFYKWGSLMTNMRKTFLLFSLSIAFSVYADIQKCTSVCNITVSDQSKTFLTDLDDTIVKRVFEDKPRMTWWQEMIVNSYIYLKKHPHMIMHPITTIYDNFHYLQRVEPMESCTLQHVHKLQQQKIRVLVATARPYYVADRTEEQLKKIGLDFSINNEDLAHLNDKLIGPTVDKDGNKITPSAVYKNGIIYCGTQDKGLTVLDFEQKTGIYPSVYIDDKKPLAASVDDAMKKAGKPCTTYLYEPAIAG